MIKCDHFYHTLAKLGIEYFAGVPDSLLKDICAYISDTVPSSRHVIAANEGGAVALAAGNYLATGKIGMVYLQNSGLGNTINPLASLTDSEVYSVPLILMIGWRGEPGVPDEPQHRKQGRVMIATLDAMGIPFEILPDDSTEADQVLSRAVDRARNLSSAVAVIVRKGTFEAYTLGASGSALYSMRREDAVELVLRSTDESDAIVSTTGMTSREVFEHREKTGVGHSRDFLTVGCMGHASQIAMGIAAAKPERTVYCIDGDGALLMHLGALAILGTSGLGNVRHIVINNGAHDSVGGQPTVGLELDLVSIAKACRYAWAGSASDPSDVARLLHELRSTNGPALLEIKVMKGARKDLGRPTTTTYQNKREFMEFLR